MMGCTEDWIYNLQRGDCESKSGAPLSVSSHITKPLPVPNMPRLVSIFSSVEATRFLKEVMWKLNDMTNVTTVFIAEHVIQI